MLQDTFGAYRNARFQERDSLFTDRPKGGPVVFQSKHAAFNLLIPPTATSEERARIVALIPTAKRHKHFASMRSSQALAQSVFGTIHTLGRLPLLADVHAEGGLPAFGGGLTSATIELERDTQTLREPRPTEVDVWLETDTRIAIECKLAEEAFGTCSRPHLEPADADYCDGSHTYQRKRKTRCTLTELGIEYWKHAPVVFRWEPDADLPACPLRSTYQLARNILAACVGEDRIFNAKSGHALIIYDDRNPAMLSGGKGDEQWRFARRDIRTPDVLRRISWQSFISQWPPDEVLDWLKAEVNAKFGIRPQSLP